MLLNIMHVFEFQKSCRTNCDTTCQICETNQWRLLHIHCFHKRRLCTTKSVYDLRTWPHTIDFMKRVRMHNRFVAQANLLFL